MKKINILYIDDQRAEYEPLAKAIRSSLRLNEWISESYKTAILIYKFENYHLYCCESEEHANELLKEIYFELVFIDFELEGGIKGTDVGKNIHKQIFKKYNRTTYQIMLTAYKEQMIEALRTGVFNDFIEKSQLNIQADFQGVFARFNSFKEEEKKRIEAEKRAEKAEAKVYEQNSIIAELQKDFNIDISSFSDEDSPLKGNSPQMKDIRWFIELYSKVNLPVLILGETGTGKELIAQEIHQKSKQYRKETTNLIALNCSAIPDTLIESVLFGYERGSHSEAKSKKKGIFEIADKSTLFLDEFGDLSPQAQVKVLRAIEEGEILPIGADEPKKVDVRVICATSKRLKELNPEDLTMNFRIDLFYRVGGLFPEVPSLRSRKDDIFDILYFRFKDSNPSPLSPDAVSALVDSDYNWPGNVRELLHFIDHTLAIFPKSRFDKTKILKLLELWKTHQPGKDLANSFEDTPNGGINKLSANETQFKDYEVSDLIKFLNHFLNEYEIYEKMYNEKPNLKKLEKILEPDNNNGWLSQKFSTSEISKEKIFNVIKDNPNLERLKSIPPIKKFYK